ncbi:MAG: glycosyltransferase [Desulfomonile tiedjei]|uniref:Glycosyltransferase n=1 Tax=Desulfomonile tiedjei TaxID=2358 RepID=A0A9D6Z2F8_9BACT|nr:glycosyltransferase [Desulfomonile tiedjei]
MRHGNRVAVIIPALNEEKAIGKVIAAIPGWVDDVIVVDNGSTDDTPTVAAQAGARVVYESRRGYGSACLTGISSLENADIVVFVDGDFSDRPEEADMLVDPIVAGQADMVIGSRVLGNREHRALTPQAIFGNWLACALMALFWKVRFTDLGPFRAISFTALQGLGMKDPDYGWTVEMQIKAVLAGLKVREVPVSYRRRIGKSKISGTIRGVVGAGTKILGTIFLAAMGTHNKRTRC